MCSEKNAPIYFSLGGFERKIITGSLLCGDVQQCLLSLPMEISRCSGSTSQADK